PALEKTVALGLSPAVLEPVRDLGWAMLEAARRPQQEDLLRAIARQKIIAQLEGRPVVETTEAAADGEDARELNWVRRRVGDAPPTDAPPTEDPVSEADTELEAELAAAASVARRQKWTIGAAAVAGILAVAALAFSLVQANRPAPEIAGATALRLETR